MPIQSVPIWLLLYQSNVSINFDFAPYLMIKSYVSYNLPTQVVIGRVPSFRFSGSMSFERFAKAAWKLKKHQIRKIYQNK